MSSSLPVCRSCGASELNPILNLGKTPLANALLTPSGQPQTEATYPLELAFCPQCALVQIMETVPPDALFSDYLYFSSFSDTMVRHAEAISARLVAERSLNADSLVMEIASNDGYLLQHYKRDGIPVLGIEPAANVAKVAVEERGIRTLCEFFGSELAQTLREGGEQADVIHANNVLAHVPDLNGFIEGLHILLKSDGVAVIEAPYLRDLVEHCEFDTIYHEHLCYFSATALATLFDRHGLLLADVERIPIHGGSLRLFVTQAAAGQRSPAVSRLLDEERALGMDREDYYRDFARRVETLKTSLRQMLATLKSEGKRIAAYGAAAKGSTLLNYFGIGKETLDFVADRSTYKQGRLMPGVHIPIVPPETLLEAMPDYVLLLTWNFAEEILAQQSEYRSRGGRFIMPIPEAKIVGEESVRAAA